MHTQTSFLNKRAGQVLLAHIFAYVLFMFLPSTVVAQTYSGPLVITKGGTYQGNWESRDSEIAAVEIRTSEPVIIENSNIRGAGYLIKSWGQSANLTVRHTNGYGITQTPYKDYKKPRRFVTVDNFKNVVVENCYMESTAGIYIGVRYEGNNTSAEGIRIRYNIAKNIDGRVYGGGNELSQFVQFNFEGAIRHAEVAWNQVINEANKSLVEDNINIYNTRGVAGSPIRIHNNYIQGAFPAPATASTYSGGGIITDGNGDINSCPAYVEAYNNQLVGLGNYSMGIAGGNNIRYHHNRAVNAATFPDGSKYNMYTSGLWGTDYYKLNTTFSNSIDNNVVGVVAWGWTNNRNDISVAEFTSFSDNTFLPNPITRQTEADEYTMWQNKLSKNGVVLGPNGSASTALANQAPSVSLTSPSANASFTEGTNVTLSASASDTDGSIARVEFFQGSTKLGEDTSSPYSYTLSSIKAGSYSFTAKATDDKGATKVSSAIQVTVTATTATTTAPTGSVSGTGKIILEQWTNLSGTGVSTIPVTQVPSSTKELTLFEAPSNVGDNYGQRIRGYVTAPVSGQYTFWIAGDNNANLYLSTSEDPANKKQIAYVNGWTSPREWTKYSSQQSATITLEAGKRYYIEALHKEENGGDNLAVGWQMPNGAKEMPITGNRLSPIGNTATQTTAPAPIEATAYGTGKITREYWGEVFGGGVGTIPVTQTPTSSGELTLFEAPTNIANNYGQRISGYVTAPVSGQYTFWISGDDDTELYLSTSEDPANKKQIAYVNGWTNPREWTKYSSQQSATITLEAGKRYYIEALHKEENGGDNLAVGWQMPNGAKEMPIAGNRLSPIGNIALAPTGVTGKIILEQWTNLTGTGVNSVPVTQVPSSTKELTLFEAPSNVGDNYGQRIRGYVTAPVSGQYTFWIAGDNNANLYLSTSEDPANKKQIAYVNGWTNPREWTKYSSQQSATITLEAGKRYYIEALHKEENGGDNLAVGWQMPNGAKEMPIAGNRLSPVTIKLESISAMSVTKVKESAPFFENATAYPNPFHDMITLNMGDQEVKLQEVVLVNQTGKIVYRAENLELTNNSLVLSLSNKNLTTGLYILKYTDTSGSSRSLKVIKE